MSLQDAFESLSEFLNSLDEEAEQQLELSHSLVIVCPDCGKNVAFRNRCPKCGGDSWIPAGHAGGIFERMKVHRWRQQIGEEDMEPGDEVAASGGNGVEPVEKRISGAAAPEPEETPPPQGDELEADETSPVSDDAKGSRTK